MHYGWMDLLSPMGIVETNIWRVSGEDSFTTLESKTNPVPENGVSLGRVNTLPYRVPENHALVLLVITTRTVEAVSAISHLVTLYADQVNGATVVEDKTLIGGAGEQNGRIYNVPYIIPSGYLVGLGIQSGATATRVIRWSVNGYLVRLHNKVVYPPVKGAEAR